MSIYDLTWKNSVFIIETSNSAIEYNGGDIYCGIKQKRLSFGREKSCYGKGGVCDRKSHSGQKRRAYAESCRIRAVQGILKISFKVG